ncbi:MAG TPA: response regulator transcription factor [Phototrophicaceae bacterium]|nr:response regulator transcription factor [Phototrophicaceae bacterium]
MDALLWGLMLKLFDDWFDFMSPETVRVMLVDDNEMVRMSMAVFLETCDDLELVAEAENGQQAVALCDTVQPDVVLMDLIMPGMDGVAATHIIRRDHPEIRVVVLTSTVDPLMVDAALTAGADACLYKNAGVDEMATTIRAVAGSDE